jgi:outer membrane autotransporter protein
LSSGNGIELVQVGGTSAANAFTLANGSIDAGAYRYRLFAGPVTGTDENWYLRSQSIDTGPEYRPETPWVTALPSLLQAGDMDMLGTLHQRVGDDNGDMTNSHRFGGRVWGRFISGDVDQKQDNPTSPSTRGNHWGFQVGADVFQSGSPDAQQNAGVYAGNLQSSANIGGLTGATPESTFVGKLRPQTTVFGAYWTWKLPSGFYADAVLQRSWYSGNGNATTGTSTNIGGTGQLASLEMGYGFRLSQHWLLEPQAQIVRMDSNIDNIAIPNATVNLRNNGTTTGRIGLRFAGDYNEDAVNPYVRVNLWRGFGGKQQVIFENTAGSTTIETQTGYNSAELGGGFTWSLTHKLSLYGEIDHLFPMGSSSTETRGTSGSVGLRWDW